MNKLTTCLWFDGKAEEAARFYTSLLPESRIDRILRSPRDYPAGKEGDVLTVEFTLAGNPYVGLNGGSEVAFNLAVSIQIHCEDQAEVDRLSDALSVAPEHEICGWVKDRYGLSWQIVPRRLTELMADPDRARAKRVMSAMMEMKRIDIAAIERAAAG
jgi:predicted 3-demethylubiquinone-9 3-methyltransferase (glyoxalase superfamily)